MAKSNLPALKNYLEAKVPALKALAAGEFKAEKLVGVVLWDLARINHLSECSQESILYCIKYATEYDLPLGGTLGALHMVPFRDRAGVYHATPIIGYRGIVELITRGDRITNVEARAIYANETFTIEYTSEGTLFRHVPVLVGDRGELIGVYSRFWKGKELIHTEVMSRGEVDKVRRASKAKDSGPWVDWYEAMALKTVVKRGAKFQSILPEAVKAIAEADEHEFSEALIDTPAEIETVTTTQTVKERLKNQKREVVPEPEPEPDSDFGPDPSYADTRMLDVVEEQEQAPVLPLNDVENPTRRGRPKANHILELRERVAVLMKNGGVGARELIDSWVLGTGKPRGWDWRLYSTKPDLETMINLLEEENATT